MQNQWTETLLCRSLQAKFAKELLLQFKSVTVRTCIQPIRSLCRKKEKCVEICKEPNFIFLRCGQEEIRFSALSVFLSQDFKKHKTQRENAENQRMS